LGRIVPSCLPDLCLLVCVHAICPPEVYAYERDYYTTRSVATWTSSKHYPAATGRSRCAGRDNPFPFHIMKTKNIYGTAKTNHLNATRRLQRKNGVKKTGKVLPAKTPAIRRVGPRPSPGQEQDMVSITSATARGGPRPGPGRERAPGPRRESAPRPPGAHRHKPSTVYLSNGVRTRSCACGTDFNSPPNRPPLHEDGPPPAGLLLRLLSQELVPGIHETFFWEPATGRGKARQPQVARSVLCVAR